MITTFKIFENQQRKYSGGNIFSNNHRYPNLPKSCPMIDVDNIGLINDNIVAIIEDKYTFESSFGNPIYEYNWQKSQFLYICNKGNIDLLYHETSSNIVKKIINDTNSIDYDIDLFKAITIVDTSDRIYVEIRDKKPVAIMYRSLNLRGNDIINDNIFKIALKLSNMLNINLYLVNDEVEKIYIKNYNSKQYAVINDFSKSLDWLRAYLSLNLISKEEAEPLILQAEANKFNI